MGSTTSLAHAHTYLYKTPVQQSPNHAPWKRCEVRGSEWKRCLRNKQEWEFIAPCMHRHRTSKQQHLTQSRAAAHKNDGCEDDCFVMCCCFLFSPTDKTKREYHSIAKGLASFQLLHSTNPKNYPRRKCVATRLVADAAYNKDCRTLRRSR